MKNKTKTALALLFALIAAALRSFQLLNTVDPATGNVIREYIPIQLIFDAGLLLAAVGTVLIAAFSKPAKQEFCETSRFMGGVGALLALTLMYDGFMSLFSVFSGSSSNAVFSLILFAVSVISALYFVSFSVSMFSEKTLFPSSWLPAVVILQSTVRLVSEYISSVNNADISEHRFSILVAAAATLFWVFYARFCVSNKKQGRLLSVFSLLFIFCVTAAILPRIAAVIVPKVFPSLYAQSSSVFSSNTLYLTDIASLIFAVAFVFYINTETSVLEPLENDDDFFKGIKAINSDSDNGKEQMIETLFSSSEPSLTEIPQEEPSAVSVSPMFSEPDKVEPTPEEPQEKKPFKVTFADNIFGEDTADKDQESTEPKSKEKEEPPIEQKPQEPIEESIEEPTEEQPEDILDENASADDIINSLLDEILGSYGDDK